MAFATRIEFTEEERELLQGILGEEKICLTTPCEVTSQVDCFAFQDQTKDQECNAYDDMWNQRYNELFTFWMRHGHSSVPQRYEPNHALGKWVHKQRQLLKKGYNGEHTSLTPNRIQALVRVNFQVDPKNRSENSWLKRYNELIFYKEMHGHCNVPQKYAPNKALGRWVHKQRHDLLREIQQEKITPIWKERVCLLTKIGFDWSSRRKLNGSMKKRLMRLSRDEV